LTDDNKRQILAEALAAVSKRMANKGYVKSMRDLELLSASDIATRYGGTKQYWDKLLREGKIPYKKTSSGKITTNVWVEGYLGNKEEVDKYIKAFKAARKSIINNYDQNRKSYGIVRCPYCRNKTLGYNYNRGDHINALCRSTDCNFKLDTQDDYT